MKKTIYKIIGGGQRVQQNLDCKLQTEIVTELSDWEDTCECCGQNHFTHVMWANDLDTLKKWANEWAGRDVSFKMVSEK